MEFVGESPAAEALKRRGIYLARSEAPIWIYGPPGCGKSHVAEWLYSLHPMGKLYRISGEGRTDKVIKDIRATPEGSTVHVDTIAPRVLGLVGLKLAEVCMEGTRRLLLESLYDPETCAKDSVAMGAVADIMPVELVGLNDRVEDIPALAAHFAEGAGKKVQKQTVEALSRISWADNVRGLKQAIEDGASRARRTIAPSNLAPEYHQAGGQPFATLSLPDMTADGAMRALVQKALEMKNYNVSAAARLLERSTPWVYKRIRQFGLSLRLPGRNQKKGPGTRG